VIWLSVSEIRKLTLNTPRAIQLKAKRQNWTCRIVDGNGGKQYRYCLSDLPSDIQTAYAESIGKNIEELQAQFKKDVNREKTIVKKASVENYNGRGAKTIEIKNIEAISLNYLEVASMRLKIIEAYNASGLSAKEFSDVYNKDLILPELKNELGKYGRVTVHTLYEWMPRYERYGLAGLAPQYAASKGGAGHLLDGKAKEIIQALYLNINKPSIASVHRDIEQFGYKINYDIVLRYIKNEIPESVKTFYRMGKTAFHNKFEPYIERDYTLLRSMEMVCSDFMTCDILCRKGNKILRAKVCVAEDMRSRKIVGWSLQETANSLGVLRVFEKMTMLYGLCDGWYIDNGKEYRNYWLCGDSWKAMRTKLDLSTLNLAAGVLNECGTKIIFCEPYHGQSKPIERFWGFVHIEFEKRFSTYIGSNTADRADEKKVYYKSVNKMKKEDLDAIPTFEEVRRKLRDFFEWYNDNWHHSGQGMDGKTPNQVFEENLKERRDIPENMRKFIFSRREECVIARNGVTMDGISYYNPQLQQYMGAAKKLKCAAI